MLANQELGDKSMCTKWYCKNINEPL